MFLFDQIVAKFHHPPKKTYKSTEKSYIENGLRQTNKSPAGKISTESFLANTIQHDGGFSITNGYASVSNYPPKETTDPTAILHPQELWELQDNLPVLREFSQHEIWHRYAT